MGSTSWLEVVSYSRAVMLKGRQHLYSITLSLAGAMEVLSSVTFAVLHAYVKRNALQHATMQVT